MSDYLASQYDQRRMVCFTLGELEMALDIDRVQEIIVMQEVRSIPRAPGYIEGVISLRGQIIPIMDLRTVFGSSKREEGEPKIVIYQVGLVRIGFVVDEVSQVIQLDKNHVLPPPPVILSGVNPKCLKGIIDRGERNILLVDLNEIISKQEANQLAESVRQQMR